jgi:integrase
MSPKRRKKYKWGTLTTEERKGYSVWVYRYFDNQVDGNGYRKRLKAIVGRTDEVTEDEALIEIEHLRMSANAERPQGITISMRGLIRRYIHEILEPCLLPLGGVQLETARMSHACAVCYRSQLNNWVEPKWGTYDVREFERPEMQALVEQWLPSITKSPDNPNGRATDAIRAVYNVMRQVFKWGRKWGYLRFNPLADDLVELPRGTTSQKHKKKAPQITAAQFFLLLNNLGELPRVAVAVDCWLGSRRSEPFGLKWKDLNLDDAVVKFEHGSVGGRVTWLKTKASSSDLPIPQDVSKLLREWRTKTPYNRPEDWVFASPYTKGQRPYWADAMMKDHIRPVALKLGLPKITWHSFRHSASRWAKAALKLEDAKELLRHEKISTTSEIYGGMSLEEKTKNQRQFIRYVKQQAKTEGWRGNTASAKTRKMPNAAGKRLSAKAIKAS